MIVLDEEQKKRVTVNILGDEYIVKGESSSQYLQEVGEYVDQIMRELAEKYPQMSMHKIAVLTSINLADEVLRLKEEVRRKGYLQQLQFHQDEGGNTEETEEEIGSDDD